VLTQWHVKPDHLRTFDIELAKQKLDAAGYPLNATGQRLDKEGKPINLRLLMPDSSDDYPKVAQFIADWYGQLGIKVSTQRLSSAALGEIIYPPEAGPGYLAKYDIELWGWSGGVDPNGLLQIFECEAIGSSSDSQYCNPAYDQMYKDQLAAPTAEARKTILAQMQNLIYDKAVYDILYYDANLVAYRTDRFAGWTKQPEANGTPFFTYSTLGYTHLTDAKAAPSATPTPPATASGSPGASTTPGASATASALPSGGPTPVDTGSGGSNTTLILGIVAVVVVIVAVVGVRSRSRKATDEDDE
jgi:peptide/nickel transport system substrate-binding protein